MKALKIIGIILLVIIVLVVGISFLLPTKTHVERSIVINEPIEKVFNQVNTFNNLLEWSPWAKIDPENTKWNFTGPEYGVGAKYTWESDNPEVVAGSQEIVESRPNGYIKTKMVFADMEGPQFAEFILVPEGENTKITWTYDGDMDGIMNKYVGAFFMDMILGPPYEQGVNDLKTYIEGLPEPMKEVIETDSTEVKTTM